MSKIIAIANQKGGVGLHIYERSFCINTPYEIYLHHTNKSSNRAESSF